jgi:hypothetical protein
MREFSNYAQHLGTPMQIQSSKLRIPPRNPRFTFSHIHLITDRCCPNRTRPNTWGNRGPRFRRSG